MIDSSHSVQSLGDSSWKRLIRAARTCVEHGNISGALVLYRRGLQLASLTPEEERQDLIPFLLETLWDRDRSFNYNYALESESEGRDLDDAECELPATGSPPCICTGALAPAALSTSCR